jgi:hypothetical protein
MKSPANEALILCLVISKNASIRFLGCCRDALLLTASGAPYCWQNKNRKPLAISVVLQVSLRFILKEEKISVAK